MAEIIPVFRLPGLSPQDVTALEVDLLQLVGGRSFLQEHTFPDLSPSRFLRPPRLVQLEGRHIVVDVAIHVEQAPDADLECRFRLAGHLAAEVDRETVERPRSLQLLARMAQPAVTHTVSHIMGALLTRHDIRNISRARRWTQRFIPWRRRRTGT